MSKTNGLTRIVTITGFGQPDGDFFEVHTATPVMGDSAIIGNFKCGFIRTVSMDSLSPPVWCGDKVVIKRLSKGLGWSVRGLA